MDKAKAAASRALELDPTLADAHKALAIVQSLLEWKWRDAERSFRRAIELNPSGAEAHTWFAMQLMAQGRREEALEQVEATRRLDPLNRSLAEAAVSLYYLAGDDERALALFEEVQELFGGAPSFYQSIGMLHCERGRFEEGLTLLEEARVLSSDAPRQLASLAYGQALAGRIDEARMLLVQIEERARSGFVPPTSLALAYVALGQKDEAFAALERGYVMHFAPLPIEAAAWPSLESLRSDPRYADLMRRLGLRTD